jgi:hypothetical protein
MGTVVVEAKATEMSARVAGELAAEADQQQLTIERGGGSDRACRTGRHAGPECRRSADALLARAANETDEAMAESSASNETAEAARLVEGSRSEASVRPVRPVPSGSPGLGAPGDVDGGGSLNAEGDQ